MRGYCPNFIIIDEPGIDPFPALTTEAVTREDEVEVASDDDGVTVTYRTTLTVTRRYE